jgi:WD40 repeat protein
VLQYDLSVFVQLSVNVTINKRASDKFSKISYSTCAAFSPSNAASLFVGGIEGALYSCEFTGRAAGTSDALAYVALVAVLHCLRAEASTRTAAHFGSISALSHHPSPDTPLLLTASYDFSVKLWHVEVLFRNNQCAETYHKRNGFACRLLNPSCWKCSRHLPLS